MKLSEFVSIKYFVFGPSQKMNMLLIPIVGCDGVLMASTCFSSKGRRNLSNIICWSVWLQGRHLDIPFFSSFWSFLTFPGQKATEILQSCLGSAPLSFPLGKCLKICQTSRRLVDQNPKLPQLTTIDMSSLTPSPSSSGSSPNLQSRPAKGRCFFQQLVSVDS